MKFRNSILPYQSPQFQFLVTVALRTVRLVTIVNVPCIWHFRARLHLVVTAATAGARLLAHAATRIKATRASARIPATAVPSSNALTRIPTRSPACDQIRTACFFLDGQHQAVSLCLARGSQTLVTSCADGRRIRMQCVMTLRLRIRIPISPLKKCKERSSALVPSIAGCLRPLLSRRHPNPIPDPISDLMHQES